MIGFIITTIALVVIWIISTVSDYKLFMNENTRKYIQKEELKNPEEVMNEFAKTNAIEILLFIGGLVVGSVLTFFNLW